MTARCKFCDSESVVKKGFVLGRQFYECKSCSHRFVDNGCFVGMRTKDRIIAAGISLYYDGCSLRRVKKQIAEIFGVRVSQVTVLNWVRKYSMLVDQYVSTLNPQLSGKYHHDETEIKVSGQSRWFWEMIDEDTRFLVADLLSKTRTTEDCKKVFRQALEKQRPTSLFTDGSFAYYDAFNKVYWTRYKNAKVEWVRRVGIKARETNNIIERKHGTLKDRLKPMRGLKVDQSSAKLLKGYVVNYNFVRPHISLKGKTPAQQAGLDGNLNTWFSLIKTSTRQTVIEEKNKAVEAPIEVAAQ